MLKRKNRKGFTLAELLIVVAIIAVLVAIAVPLFVGALGKAEDATKDANIRTTRSTAIVYLLENSEKTAAGEVWAAPTGQGTENNVRAWTVDATISSNGDFTKLVVTPIATGVAKTDKSYTGTATYTTAGEAKKADNGGYTVKLLLTETSVTDIPKS